MKSDTTEPAVGLLNLDETATGTSYSTAPSTHPTPQDDEQPHVSTSDTINCFSTPRHSPCSSCSLIISAFRAHHLSYIRNQMASMLHALSSTFTTCGCGSNTKDCALNLMAEFVDGRLPVAASPPSQQANDPSGTDLRSHQVDLGPLVGAQRGFHTMKSHFSMARMNGTEMIPGQPTDPGDQRATVGVNGLVQRENYLLPDHLDGGVPKVKTATAPSSVSLSPPPPATGSQVEEDRSKEVSDPPRTPDLSPSHPRRLLPDAACHSTYHSPSPSDSDPQLQLEDEKQMPSKMRKRWIRRSMEGLSPVSPSPSVSPCGSNISLGSVLDEGQMEVDLVSSDTKDMPPPPMPANLDPTTVSSTCSSSPRVLTSNLSSLSSAQTPDLLASLSPSTSFVNLSLLSPTASYPSNPSPLSPELSTLTSFLPITSTLAFSPDADPPIQMDVDKDSCDSQSTRHSPSLNARSPQSLTSSEPLRREQPPPMSRMDSPRPASPSRQTSSVPGPLPDAEPPQALSSPRTNGSSPPLSSLQAAPKVKMSLKDFAMRKKTQREEVQVRGAVLPSDTLPPSEQSGTGGAHEEDTVRDPNGCEQAARDVAAPRVASDDAARSDFDVESIDLSSRPIFHAGSRSSASAKAGIVSAASRPLPDPATNICN
ncbi:hypothetical protein EDB87DRAFT_570726 [Lactarius vividus]|nr:hypothetical protein EDB87DRAFT_570726 [Lactarius vividus]